MKEERASYRITDMLVSERPRERLALYGPQVLTNPELLAILLRTGIPGENAVQVGYRLLDELGGLPGIHRASYLEVCEQHGIGPAKAAQIKAAIELGRRLNSIDPEERPSINSPDDAAAFVQYEMSALEQEELWILLLDSRNRIVYLDKRYRGSLNSSQVRVGEIFNEAVKRNSASIIVIHNHPSGDPTPSTDDIKLTRLIVEAGRLLDIEVLDHLVIGGVRNVSLKKRGLGFG